MTEDEKQAEALSDRLRAWADLISSGYEVPAAAQTVLEAAEYIKRSEASQAAVVEAGNLALEYWAHRQQRYKNRHPIWVQKMRAALAMRERKSHEG